MAGTIALTGATGFIGGHLAQALVGAGWKVRILARRPTVPAPLESLPVEIVLGALDEPASLHQLVQDATAVVHVAGLVKARSRRAFFRVNADGVARLLDAVCAQGSDPRFLLVSSLAAREPGLSAYAASKRAGEAVMAEHGEALPWNVLRLPVVYGPHDRNTLPFFRAISRGLGPLLAPEAARVSCLYVSDVSSAVLALLNAGPETHHQTYEIHDGQPGGYTWRDLIDTAATHLNTRPRMIRMPRSVLTAAAHINTLAGSVSGSAAIFGPDKVREMHHLDWVCRDDQWVKQMAWRPLVPLSKGFADTILWYRKQNWL